MPYKSVQGEKIQTGNDLIVKKKKKEELEKWLRALNYCCGKQKCSFQHTHGRRVKTVSNSSSGILLWPLQALHKCSRPIGKTYIK